MGDGFATKEILHSRAFGIMNYEQMAESYLHDSNSCVVLTFMMCKGKLHGGC